MRLAVPQVACVVDEDPHWAATERDATGGRSSDVAAPRRWTACACDAREVQRTTELGRHRAGHALRCFALRRAGTGPGW